MELSVTQARKRSGRTGAGPEGAIPSRSTLAALRREAQARMELDAVAYSADGREFRYEAPIAADIEVGGWVTLAVPGGPRYLGQITTEEIAVREGPELHVDLHRGNSQEGERLRRAGWKLRIRHTAGTGAILARETGRKLLEPATHDTFDEASITAADGPLVTRYLESMSGRGARLHVGAVQRCADAPAAFLRADGFNRHTFLCGQSGSGKTYALGLILEQLLLRTTLNLMIIDPNSDFVRLNVVRDGVRAATAREYRSRARRLQILRPAAVAHDRRNVLRAWFSDLAEVEQAAALRLDPLADREEYSELANVAATFHGRRYSLHDVLRTAIASGRAAGQQLALRIQNLRVADWSVWAHGRDPGARDVIREATRAVVVDTGTISSATEKAAVSAVALGNLWRAREQRRPTLIVIDEAHNVCPGEPVNALQQNATDYCVSIAAEGRKFGLYLLLSTQRPQKVHRNILSQCDNLALMRMNSRADLADLSEAFSFVAPSLLEEAMRFKQGETLLAGKIVPAPFIARVGGRISEEAGADLPTTWGHSPRRRRA